MKLIRVQYTIEKDFIPQNKKNVAAVMNALRDLGRDDVKYSYFQSQKEPKTFMHIVTYKTKEAEDYPSSLEEFKVFQKDLKLHLEMPPEVAVFEYIDSFGEM